MERALISPELIRQALQPDYPHWAQAVSAYRHHKPYGNRPQILFVHVSATRGQLQCQRKHCQRKTDVMPDQRIVEKCSFCGSYETKWIKEPLYERVRVMGTRGGKSDPYTGRDFCLDLERWADASALAEFRSYDGARILEMSGLYDMGVRRIAVALNVMGRDCSKSGIHRIFDFWKVAWEHGQEVAMMAEGERMDFMQRTKGNAILTNIRARE